MFFRFLETHRPSSYSGSDRIGFGTGRNTTVTKLIKASKNSTISFGAGRNATVTKQMRAVGGFALVALESGGMPRLPNVVLGKFVGETCFGTGWNATVTKQTTQVLKMRTCFETGRNANHPCYRLGSMGGFATAQNALRCCAQHKLKSGFAEREYGACLSFPCDFKPLPAAFLLPLALKRLRLGRRRAVEHLRGLQTVRDLLGKIHKAV